MQQQGASELKRGEDPMGVGSGPLCERCVRAQIKLQGAGLLWELVVTLVMHAI